MNDTKQQILDLAAQLTQERGFGGFSYLDLAEKIGIKAASIHYYFKGKEDLAFGMIEWIRKMHLASFQEMERTISTPQGRLKALIQHFQGYAKNDQFCLCGMMAAEFYTFSPRVRNLLNDYFSDFESNIAKQFKEMKHKSANLQATKFLSALEGSLLIARLRNDPKLISQIMADFMKI